MYVCKEKKSHPNIYKAHIKNIKMEIRLRDESTQRKSTPSMKSGIQIWIDVHWAQKEAINTSTLEAPAWSRERGEKKD